MERPAVSVPTPVIEIFAAGTHTAMSGQQLAFAEADLQATADGYDPALHQAPVVIGHPKTDDPAYGWVSSVAAADGRMTAHLDQLDPAFAEAVQAGRYKKVSAAFWSPKAPGNPKPGIYYLKHVGFLGAKAPAVKGLAPVQFAGDDEGVVTVEFAEGAATLWRVSAALRSIGRILGALRDRMIETDGVEATKKLVDEWDLDRITSIAGELEGAADAEQTPAYAAPDTQEAPVTTKVPAAPAAANPPTADDVAARERDLATREAAFAERQARADAETTVAALVAAGKVLPRDQGFLVAFMAGLDDAGTVEFAEGDQTVKRPRREAFAKFLDGLPRIVEFAELAGPEGAAADLVEFAGADGLAVDQADLAVHARAVEYQRQNPGTDYLTAVKAVGRK